MNVFQTAKATAKTIAKAAAGAMGSRLVGEAFKSRQKRPIGRGGGAHASQPGHSAWFKPKSKKRKRGRSRKTGRSRKAKCVTRSQVLSMINKKDDMPLGEHQVTLTSITPPMSSNTQSTMFQDINGNAFTLDYYKAWDAVSVLWNGKPAAPNTFTIAATNTPIDTPIKVSKMLAEFRMVNNGFVQLEVEMYVATPKIMTDTDFQVTWSSAYSELKYVTGGTSAPMYGQFHKDYYANPGQIPSLKKF